MAELINAGTWVEIRHVVLPPSGRAPQVPDDTRQVPLEMRARGRLEQPAAMGEQAEIVTVTGRRLLGVLSESNPAYSHSYGPPVPELLDICGEVRALLRKGGESG